MHCDAQPAIGVVVIIFFIIIFLYFFIIFLFFFFIFLLFFFIVVVVIIFIFIIIFFVIIIFFFVVVLVVLVVRPSTLRVASRGVVRLDLLHEKLTCVGRKVRWLNIASQGRQELPFRARMPKTTSPDESSVDAIFFLDSSKRSTKYLSC